MPAVLSQGLEEGLLPEPSFLDQLGGKERNEHFRIRTNHTCKFVQETGSG